MKSELLRFTSYIVGAIRPLRCTANLEFSVCKTYVQCCTYPMHHELLIWRRFIFILPWHLTFKFARPFMAPVEDTIRFKWSTQQHFGSLHYTCYIERLQSMVRGHLVHTDLGLILAGMPSNMFRYGGSGTKQENSSLRFTKFQDSFLQNKLKSQFYLTNSCSTVMFTTSNVPTNL